MGTPTVIRRTWAKQFGHLRRHARQMALAALPLVITSLAATGSVLTGTRRGWGLTVLASIGLMTAYAWLEHRNHVLFARDDWFGTVSWLRRTKAFRSEQLVRIERVSIRFGGKPPAEYVVFVDSDGRALFRTQTVLWADT